MTGMLFFRILLRIFIVLGWFFVLLFFLYRPWTSVTSTARSLNILAWPQIIDGQFLAVFENRHGIKIHITYCENNEEMLAKLKNVTDHGYDLAMPSHFFVDTFVEEGLIKPFDQTQIKFFEKVHPKLRAL